MTVPVQVHADQRPFIFGEVLFDCFPEGQVLGGAPFNVAWNLRGLGCNPLVVTAVGMDELGREVLRRVAHWGLDRTGLQQCDGKPTGRVDIEISSGEPSYRFWDDVAFDHIRYDEQLMATTKPTLLYHGTLALRSQVSRQTIQRMRTEVISRGCPVFIDVNIRLPHFDPALVPLILNQADHVKLNHDELYLLTGERASPSADEAERWQLRRKLGERLMRQFAVRNLWITAAEEGAAWLGTNGEFICTAAPEVDDVVDTVGAGDALTAVIIQGLLHDRNREQILFDATRFAARICTIRGAICNDPSFYASTLGCA
jgi:fructokinase